ncbi:fibronectin type III domain-containing protein [Seonamhaeicola maritimus]|uniref:Fibronectin type III domain-containing protein n=1 Tax=Seonamhaeicola maritimus TaxID=2591822 RepID=A0A5C7GM00_9FLAO|nr:fibronectin type III domain-containing protein [Seonamhaeicola maritimus]TXG39536.1 fibronectin type III domain-containing protein [Seonamhaeicola maritimus]
MKKSYLYITLFFGLILSCGGSDKDEIIEPENTAPTVPSIVYPLNNTLCVNNEVKFEWNSSIDAEGNRITYKIEVSENSSFSPLAYSETSFIDSKTISLTKGKAYYWRIKAVDSQYAESGYSSVSHFLTEGEGISNHIPFAPSLLAPALDSEIAGTSTTLSWSASDVDNDPLTFDVYLDTSAQPTTKVSENQSGTTFDVTGLSPASTYYFKVVVKDDKGGTSIGQVWSFATK